MLARRSAKGLGGLYALALIFALIALSLSWTVAQADELPTFKLVFRADGSFDPPRLEVPRGRFKLELRNDSKEPVEFESLQLRKEKVLGPGVSSFVVITVSRPGEYPFFDDFHQQFKGVIVVK
jgi:hypothetical protein